jgi:hypothetical protein
MASKDVRINGFRLQNLIREQTTQRDVLAKQFEGSLSKFQGEVKDAPQIVMEQLEATERRIAKLQVVQAQYNAFVRTEVDGGNPTLLYAVKLIGSLGRIEKQWRQAAIGKENRYGYDSDKQRNNDTVYAASTISPADAAELAKLAGRRAARFRGAIAVGNGKEMSVEVDSELEDLFR